MRFTILAALAGVGIGLMAGGRFRFLARRTLRLWPLLALGAVFQVAAGRANGDAGLVLLLASLGFLLAFAVANLLTVGMWLVAGGIALNLAVISLNSGMPVRPSALEQAGVADPGGAADVRLSPKHHLERRSDRLVVLGDVIPVAPLREVLSFGDLLMAVGAADVIVHLLAPPAGRRTLEASATGG
jgi:hypothetical protein